MTTVTTIGYDWQRLSDEIVSQARAARRKLETAICGASAPPPLHLSEALEDAANEYLDVCDQISALHTQRSSFHRSIDEGFAGRESRQQIVHGEASLEPAALLAEYFREPVEDQSDRTRL